MNPNIIYKNNFHRTCICAVGLILTVVFVTPDLIISSIYTNGIEQTEKEEKVEEATYIYQSGSKKRKKRIDKTFSPTKNASILRSKKEMILSEQTYNQVSIYLTNRQLLI